MTIRATTIPARVLTAAAAVALCACQKGPPAPPAQTPEAPAKAAEVDAARLAAPEPEQWVAPGRDAAGTYFSPLKDINAGNVGNAWLCLGLSPRHESRPGIDPARDRRRDVCDQQFRARVRARRGDAAGSSGNTTRTSTVNGRATRAATPSIADWRRSTADYSWPRSTAGSTPSTHAPARWCGRSTR